jgi:predicted DNA-binding transcriptional regulator YafY
MRRDARLARLMSLLRERRTMSAAEMAVATGVSERTIWRDMAHLAATGQPVAGTRGAGYRITADITLPPLNLTRAELEVLHLGLSILGQGGDEQARAAALSLSDKIDTALSEEAGQAQHRFGHALPPFGRSERGFRHMPTFRAALRARQKLSVTLEDGQRLRLRPLRLDYWGRSWDCAGWDEAAEAFARFRLDQVLDMAALPELFVDEPGKRLRDMA